MKNKTIILTAGLLMFTGCGRKTNTVEVDKILEVDRVVQVQVQAQELYSSTANVILDRDSGNPGKLEVNGYVSISRSIRMVRPSRAQRPGWLTLQMSNGNSYCYQARVGTDRYKLRGKLVSGACDEGNVVLERPTSLLAHTSSLTVLIHDPELSNGVVTLKVSIHE